MIGESRFTNQKTDQPKSTRTIVARPPNTPPCRLDQTQKMGTSHQSRRKLIQPTSKSQSQPNVSPVNTMVLT